MKIASTVIMAFCLPVLLFSQNSFEKDYSFDGIYHVYGKSVKQSSDGCYLSAGITFDAGYGPSIFMFKADEKGDSLWFETNWIYVQEEVPYKMLEQPGLGYVAGPSYYNPFMSNILCYLVQTNFDGLRNWDDWYSGMYDYSFPVDFIINADEKTIILNNSVSMNGNEELVMMHEIDSNGIQLNTFSFPHDEDLSPICLIEKDDGGYLSAGFIGETSVLYLQSISAGFDEEWMIPHDVLNQLVNPYYLSLLEQVNENITAVTSTVNPDNNLAEGVILNFVTGGTLLEIHHIKQDYSIHFADAILSSDGHIIVCGKILEFESASETLLLYKISTDGEIIWERYFHGLGIAAGYALDQADDGGFAIAGMTRKSEQDLKRYYLLKTDEEGLVTSTDKHPAVKNEFTLRPNPATDRVTLYPQNKRMNFNLMLVNSGGQQMMTLTGLKGAQEIDVGSFSPGIYLLRIISGDHSIVKKIVVRR